MEEKEFKSKFSEIKDLSDFEKGNFLAALYIHSILSWDRHIKSQVIEVLENTANSLGSIINQSGFANAFFLQLNDAVEFLKNNGEISELKKSIEEKIGKWENTEKSYF